MTDSPAAMTLWSGMIANSKTARGSVALTADRSPGPNRPHLSERGSAVSIMLPPDSDGNNRSRGWRAKDLTPTEVAPIIHRFAKRVQAGAPDECWPWQGYCATTGYGVLHGADRVPLLAHRIAWVAFTGQSLTGQMTIDHLCNNRSCVNPDHLEPVTMAENNRRKRERRGWGTRADQGRPVVCDECGTVTRRDKVRRHQRNMHGAA